MAPLSWTTIEGILSEITVIIISDVYDDDDDDYDDDDDVHELLRCLQFQVRPLPW